MASAQAIASSSVYRPENVMAAAIATSAHASASLLARLTSVSHVGSDAINAATSRPRVPKQRKRIDAAAMIAIQPKKADSNRALRNSVMALACDVSRAASE